MKILQHSVLSSCRSIYYLSNGRLREVKTKENFTLLALKGAAVAYERWSLTRGSKYSDMTGKLFFYFGKMYNVFMEQYLPGCLY